MDNFNCVAAYMMKLYEIKYKKQIEEVTLQVLLYLLQKESFYTTGKLLFEADFYAYKFGPVILDFHKLFTSHLFVKMPDEDFIHNTKNLFDSLFDKYGSHSMLTLTMLARDQYWEQAMLKSLPDNDCCEKIIFSSNTHDI